jgi:hypothetical protein
MTHIVLTIPMSIITTERAFLSMNIVKTILCNKMVDKFLVNNLAVCIESEIAEILNSYSILDEFNYPKECRL